MTTICGRNSDDMFCLTRDGDIEITSTGYPGSKGHAYHKGSLYYYARQGIEADSKEELDAFGRNITDRLFIRLCECVFGFVMGKEDTFKSLSCRKSDNGKYIARLEMVGMTFEYDLGFMVELIEKFLKTEGNKQ